MKKCIFSRAIAAFMFSIATRAGSKSVWAASFAPRRARQTVFTLKRISAGERYASVYNIDYSRCIFCGYCVEACPTDAITHGHGFELATYDINSMVYRKEQLLEKDVAAVPAGK